MRTYDMGFRVKRGKIFAPLFMLLLGLGLGVLSRLLDIYTQTLGNIFSQFAIWILLGTVISIYSKTQFRAMLNVFLLCVGMLATYYFTAYITDGVYSEIFIIGWTAFALCSPVMALVAWYAKRKGVFAKIISVAIVVASFSSSIVFFDRLRFYDFIINAVLITSYSLGKSKEATARRYNEEKENNQNHFNRSCKSVCHRCGIGFWRKCLCKRNDG